MPAPTPDPQLLELLNQELDRAGTHASYDEDAKAAALQVATVAFQGEAKHAFFPTEITEMVRACGGELIMSWPDITAVSAIDGPAGPSSESIDVSTVEIDDDELILNTGWRAGAYTVSYTHGLAECPPDVARAIVLIATSILAQGPWDDRGYAVDDGSGLMRLLTAGVAGASFSIPEVQAALFRYRDYWVG